LDPKIAAASLATAVLSIGSPGLPREKDEVVKTSEKLIEEAIKDLNITDRTTAESINKIRKYLSAHVDSYLMHGFDRSEITKRLGDRGDLPKGAYIISVGANVRGRHKLSFIESCIRDADSEQHLMTDGDENAHKLSIFVKSIVNNSGRRSVIVICASRSGNSLNVDCLFQMIPNLFDLSGAVNPIDYIKIFVDKYPIPIKIGNSIHSKQFWSNEDVAINGRNLTIFIDNQFYYFNDKPRWNSLVYGKLEDGCMHVVVGFAFNETAYQADLDAHR